MLKLVILVLQWEKNTCLHMKSLHLRTAIISVHVQFEPKECLLGHQKRTFKS